MLLTDLAAELGHQLFGFFERDLALDRPPLGRKLKPDAHAVCGVIDDAGRHLPMLRMGAAEGVNLDCLNPVVISRRDLAQFGAGHFCVTWRSAPLLIYGVRQVSHYHSNGPYSTTTE